MRALAWIIACVLLAAPAYAQRAPITLDLAEDHVDITTGFNGTNLIVYGITPSNGDIVFTLRGPEKTMVVRRKAAVLGAWINAQSVEFHRVPGYYDYARTSPIRLMPEAVRKVVGLSSLDFYPEDRLSDSDARRFREALIRNKQAQGLFPPQGRSIETISKGFYKAVFPLPANMPTGAYRIDAYIVNGERITPGMQKILQVGQVGFSAQVYLFAHNHAWIYSLLAISLALFAGWGAFTFLRRD